MKPANPEFARMLALANTFRVMLSPFKLKDQITILMSMLEMVGVTLARDGRHDDHKDLWDCVSKLDRIIFEQHSTTFHPEAGELRSQLVEAIGAIFGTGDDGEPGQPDDQVVH